MKAKDLAKQLNENPDFEVVAVFAEIYDDKFGYGALNYQKFKVVDIADIGYSEKVISLDLETE